MKRFTFYISLLCLLSLLLASMAFAWPPAPGQQVTPPQYFPETGHVVRAPFIDYYLSTDGVAQYGFPITDDFVDLTTGLLVQYFEKGRLEWHPGNADPYKVQLGLLADEMGKRQPPIPISQMPPANDPNCLNFLETGHTVCMAFRDYWLANGGLDRFGYPITEFTVENGVLVQYFQRARLEWNPNRAAVQVAPLGLIYYRWAKLDESRLLAPDRFAQFNNAPTAILARASVFQASPFVGDDQVAFINVTDQLGRPLADAAVTLIVRYADHDTAYQLPPTSASGTTFQTFTVEDSPAGFTVALQFIVTHAGLFSDTRTSFMIWY
ncbi:MAG: hypothetical protein IT317_02210 [Anaerolineales bacterium]|nr:hypothetical protein [Anaerolineales bacterium]